MECDRCHPEQYECDRQILPWLDQARFVNNQREWQLWRDQDTLGETICHIFVFTVCIFPEDFFVIIAVVIGNDFLVLLCHGNDYNTRGVALFIFWFIVLGFCAKLLVFWFEISEEDFIEFFKERLNFF